MKLKYDDKYIKLGFKIAYYRKLKGYTQEQLAENIGISTGFISEIEAPNMVKSMSLDTVFSIADFLKIPAKNFFDFDDD